MWDTIGILLTAVATLIAACFAASAAWLSRDTAKENLRLAVANRRQRFVEATDELLERIIVKGDITFEIIGEWPKIAESEKYVLPPSVKELADQMWKKSREAAALHKELHDVDLDIEENKRIQKREEYYALLREIATDKENLLKRTGQEMRPFISFTE